MNSFPVYCPYNGGFPKIRKNRGESIESELQVVVLYMELFSCEVINIGILKCSWMRKSLRESAYGSASGSAYERMGTEPGINYHVASNRFVSLDQQYLVVRHLVSAKRR